ncbi:MAG: polysaccharide deacetylase family protein [Kiritimatiellaeota bacterium]|nr:polysaccharide deacetylase family protein [Kiritimatiellota bacterium]
MNRDKLPVLRRVGARRCFNVGGVAAAVLGLCGCQPPLRPFTVPPGSLAYYVPVAEKLVALSFDDGPNDPCTPALLDVLDKEKAPATFFLIGANAERHPDIVRRMAQAGHAIGNHSWEHPRYDRLAPDEIRQQLRKTDELLEKLTGVKPLLARPPYGLYGPGFFDICRTEGLVVGGWSAEAHDWNPHTPEQLVQLLLDQTAPGVIYLLHDGMETNDGPHRVASVQAVALLVPELKRRGYRLVTIPELLRHATTPAVRFSNGAELLGLHLPEGPLAPGRPMTAQFYWRLPAGMRREAFQVGLLIGAEQHTLGWLFSNRAEARNAPLPAGGDAWKETATWTVKLPPGLPPGRHPVSLALCCGSYRWKDRLPLQSNWPSQRRRVTLPATLDIQPAPAGVRP